MEEDTSWQLHLDSSTDNTSAGWISTRRNLDDDDDVPDEEEMAVVVVVAALNGRVFSPLPPPRVIEER